MCGAGGGVWPALATGDMASRLLFYPIYSQYMGSSGGISEKGFSALLCDVYVFYI